MPGRLVRTPARLLQAIAVLAVACSLGVAWFAARQPTLGLVLVATGQNVGLIRDAQVHGPVVLAGASKIIRLEAGDLRTVSDTIDDQDAARHFFDRQTAIAILLRTPLTVTAGGLRLSIDPRPRGLNDLPALFWIQLLSGIAGCIIAGFVWAWDSDSMANRLFGITGPLFLMLTAAAAIYSTRALAIDGTLFAVLAAINQIGAGLFGLAMVLLFLIYPHRLASASLMRAIAGAALLWMAAAAAGLFANRTTGSHGLIAAELVLLGLAIWLQYRATRHDPAARAVLLWMGTAVLAGAGSFIAIVILPVLFGQAPQTSEGAAFPLFLVIYGGIVLGLRRYRLFEAREWSFRLLVAAVGAAALCLLDAALIGLLRFTWDAALGLSVLLTGLAYLPVRDRLARRILQTDRMRHDEMFAAAIDVAFAAANERDQRWQALLSRLFQPLETHRCPAAIAQAVIAEDGCALLVPATAGSPALRLAYARSGKRLFTREDRLLVDALALLTDRAADALLSYNRGALAERRRMAQDLHDDIGARLLSGLHIADGPVRTLLHDALRDIRTLVTGLIGDSLPIGRALADIRHEAATRLELAGIDLDWPVNMVVGGLLDYAQYKAISSSLREAISNVIRHSAATRVCVYVNFGEGHGLIRVGDDGRGIAADVARGTGLSSMTDRMTRIGGSLTIETPTKGVSLILRWPLSKANSTLGEEVAYAG